MIHARTDYQKRIQDSANEIGVDEPVFLLRAQDNFFIVMLVFYMLLNEFMSLVGREGRMPRIVRRVTETLMKHVWLAKEWRWTHKTKLPDMPESAVSGVVARHDEEGGG